MLRLTRVTSLLHVNSLWLCILYSFFTSAADQKIIFMFLITTKQIRNTVKFSIFTEKFTKIRLMNYADRGIASCSWCLVPGSRSKFGNWTTVPSVYIFSPPPVKPEGTIGLHSVCPSVCLSVTLKWFPDDN